MNTPCGRKFEHWDGFDGPLTAWCIESHLCPHCERIRELLSNGEELYLAAMALENLVLELGVSDDFKLRYPNVYESLRQARARVNEAAEPWRNEEVRDGGV